MAHRMTPPNTVDAERLRARLAELRDRWETSAADEETLDAAIEALAARAEPQGKAEREQPSPLGGWHEPAIADTPPTGEDTAAAREVEVQAYREMHHRLDCLLGEQLQVEHEGDYRAAIENTVQSVAALAQRPAAPREGVRGSGEAQRG